MNFSTTLHKSDIICPAAVPLAAQTTNPVLKSTQAGKADTTTVPHSTIPRTVSDESSSQVVSSLPAASKAEEVRSHQAADRLHSLKPPPLLISVAATPVAEVEKGASTLLDKQRGVDAAADSVARASSIGAAQESQGADPGVVHVCRKPPPVAYNSQWPSLLMQLMSLPSNGDEWEPVMDRIATHPEEIEKTGLHGGQNALHSACIRYPPAHVVRALVEAAPHTATMQNHNDEAPLHQASFTASEEVQEILIRAVPEAVHLVDRYGDTPLHIATRQGATFPLMELLVRTAPETISMANKRGATPFWLLPRRYLQAETLQEIFTVPTVGGGDDDNDENSSDSEEEDDYYQHDWDLLVLFLRFSYYDAEEAVKRQAAASCQSPDPLQFEWMVYAAASTLACPRETLQFLCRAFPHAALQYDKGGYTPLLLATRAAEMEEPVNWDEHEDGYRDLSEPSSTISLRIEERTFPAEAALSIGDADFLRRQVMDVESVERRFAAGARRVENDENYVEDYLASDKLSSKPSVLEILLEWSPASASCTDQEGRLPLVHALLAGKSWTSLRKLVAACPRALETRDVSSGLFPFQLAATYAPDLSTIYNMVRTLPELLAAGMVRSTAGGPVSLAADESEPPCKKCKIDATEQTILPSESSGLRHTAL